MDELDKAIAEFHSNTIERGRILANIKTLWKAKNPRPHGAWDRFCTIELKISRETADRLIRGIANGRCNSESAAGHPGPVVTKAEHPKKSQIRQILTAHPERSNAAIAEELSSDRGTVRKVREEMGLPPSKGKRRPRSNNNVARMPRGAFSTTTPDVVVPVPEGYDPTYPGWDFEMEHRKNIENVKKHLSKCSAFELGYLWTVILPLHYPEQFKSRRKSNVSKVQPSPSTGSTDAEIEVGDRILH